MADQRQLERLKHSLEEWNSWRLERPDVCPDLIRADLSGADLGHANLSGAKLGGANLSHANLNKAFLRGADLFRTNLSEAILNEINLSKTLLSHANLTRTDLTRADLSGAYLGYTDISHAKLGHANLSEVVLMEATLTGANLENANLSNTILIEANLNYANLDEADLSQARMSGTVLGGLDLRSVKGLETVIHEGPSHLSVNTLYRSHGEIPEIFVRGTGAPDVFIDYIRSLVTHPIEYYTCFISYSSKDELFARRLHNDLQQEGIRCWFAPEDMNIGDKIRHRIEEAIRVYDKLLLILSESSIASYWVAYEVERALNKEPQGIPNVLYPIRVDQAILTCTTDWAKDIKSTRHIGNFEHWTDPQQYHDNFKRLLYALRSEDTQV
jgi:uncharacterized protein YjbI with pentapeptide repeats